MKKFIMLLHDAGRFPADISPDQIQAIIQRSDCRDRRPNSAG